MLATLGPIVGQASGRLGAIVASHNKGGPYFRNGTIPTTSTTSYALAAKARMGAASTAWQALTAAQRAAWGEWALENPWTNRLGKQITLPAISAHNSCYTRAHLSGTNPLTLPPIDPAPMPLATSSLNLDIGPGAFDITFTPTPLGAGETLWLEACVSNSPGVNYVNNKLRWIGLSAAAQASPFDFQTLIEARFGSLIVDQTVTVFASVWGWGETLLSPPVRLDGLVVDTT